MGADLYIMRLHKKQEEKYRPQFDKWVKIRGKAENDADRDAAQEQVTKYYNLMNERGYFRDSYNNSSLLWLFELSWWEDIGKMVTKRGNLTPQKAQVLLDMLKEREPIFKKNLANFTEYDRKKESKQEIDDYFTEKYKNFRSFLQEAIDLNQKIACSI